MLGSFFNEKEFQVLKIISDSAKLSNARVYLIGGVVRDMLLGKKSVDIDITIAGNIDNFLSVLKTKINCKILKTQPDLKTAKVNFYDNFSVDFATTRQESYENKKGIPTPSNFGCELKDDILRRDFSINSLAISLNNNDFGQIIDFVNGQDDLKNKKLRILHDKSFFDDPSRIIRGFKFANRFNFDLEEKTLQLQKTYINNIDYSINVSPERLKKEILDSFKSISETIYNKFFEQQIYKILSDKINKISYKKIAETIEKYDITKEKIPFIFFACIFLNPENYELFSKMNLSKEEVKILQEINFADKNSENINKTDIFKQYSKKQKESLILELLIQNNPAIKIYLEEMKDIKVETTGDDLLKLGLKPSKDFKVIFDKILEEKINGNLSDKISELNFVKNLIQP